jgi:hypothetical protein
MALFDSHQRCDWNRLVENFLAVLDVSKTEL